MSGPDWQISPHDMPLSSYDVLKHQTVQAMFCYQLDFSITQRFCAWQRRTRDICLELDERCFFLLS